MYKTMMEEAVSDEHFAWALAAITRNKGAAGVDGMTTAQWGTHLNTNWWILKQRQTPERDLRSKPRKAGGNTKAKRWRANAGNPNGTGSVHPAVAVTRDDAGFRPDVQ